jgi:uncharacterized membrane protein (DUF4010 family)
VDEIATAGLVWGLAGAFLIGALVGIERERRKAIAGTVDVSGVRTFIVFAEAGAIAAWLSLRLASPWVFVAAILGVASLVIAAYVVHARVAPQDLGITTETSSIVVCLLGGACVLGPPQVAVALGVATAVVLASRQRLHDMVSRIASDDVDAALKLLVATFIVLPLLPHEAVDPWGVIFPYQLWLLVILIAALSLVGYVATRIAGPERGTAITGLAGGLVSSTAVTLAFARRSVVEKASPGLTEALAAGLMLSWGVMVARIVAIAAVVHAPLVLALAVPSAAMLCVILASAAVFYRSGRATSREAHPDVPLRNPFSLTAAMKFGAFFAAVLFLVKVAKWALPENGYYVVAALAGLTDVDAITLSMANLARAGRAELSGASTAIIIAALSNTLVKCGILLALATTALRVRMVAATLFVMVAGVAGIWLG